MTDPIDRETAHRIADDEYRRQLQPRCDVVMGAMRMPTISRRGCHECGSPGARCIDHRVEQVGLERVECPVCGAIQLIQWEAYSVAAGSGHHGLIRYERRPEGSVYEARQAALEQKRSAERRERSSREQWAKKSVFERLFN